MINSNTKHVLFLVLIVFILLMSWSTIDSNVFANNVIKGASTERSKTNVSLQETEELDQLILDYLDRSSIDTSKIAYAIYDINEDQTTLWNNQTDFISASLYKVPLAMLYYEYVSEESITSDSSITYCTTCYEAGGPIGDTYPVGSQIQVAQLLYDVVAYSDNTAGHILFENLGGWTKYRFLIQKYSTQPLTITEKEENVFSAAYALDVLKQLYTYANSTYAPLVEAMREVYPKEYLNRYQPNSTIQKYGAYGSARNAMGFVDGENPYLIVVLCDLDELGVEVIGQINSIAYAYFAIK